MRLVAEGSIPSHREAKGQGGIKGVFEDPRMHPDVNPMRFEGKRLIDGRFEMIVNR